MLNSVECVVGDRRLIIETGKLAGQADGAVTVRFGDTVVLVTVCFSEESQKGGDFLRLTVDYEERHYAVGKIPGSFIRREGRPGEQATLAARLTDRSLRPLFPKNLSDEIQIIVTVLSTDQETDPDILAVTGASAALAISAVPFMGPVSAVRVGYIEDNLVLNPSLSQMNDSLLDLIVVSTKEAIVMLEAGADEVSEEILLAAIKLGHDANQEIVKLQESLRQTYGKPKVEVKAGEVNHELMVAISSDFGDRLNQAVSQVNRAEREEIIASVKQGAVDKLQERFPEADIIDAIEDQLKKAARKSILGRKLHLDGRQVKEIRSISNEVGLLPRTHGSGLFSRGQTQVLTITTLGSLSQAQMIDDLSLEDTKRFMHHYNFPPFSTGEVKRMGGRSRREIGHGALAERAIAAIIPDKEEFSYTIRLVSEVLSSNGSTSMASVCSSSLSLMDAGVPIKAPVVGIAMGLVAEGDDNYVILTDIEGMEDHYGDMDFKIAGTNQGITAIQLDIKLQGLSYKIVSEAIRQAREAHSELLDKLRQTISSSRAEVSPHAPRMYRLTINPEKIGTVIGPGGKTIRSIISETKATIDVDNDGTVIIGSPSEEAALKAVGMIENLTREVEVGVIYTGKVTRLLNFGAFVEILPGKEGLVHVSELADYHVSRVEDVVKVGDEIMVKVIEVDRLGRVNLSRRAVLGDSSPERATGASDSTSSGDRPRGHPSHRPASRERDRRDSRDRHRSKK